MEGLMMIYDHKERG